MHGVMVDVTQQAQTNSAGQDDVQCLEVECDS